MTTELTYDDFAGEITRRALNKTRAKAGLSKIRQVDQRLFRMSTADLEDAIELLAPKPKRGRNTSPALTEAKATARKAKATKAKPARKGRTKGKGPNPHTIAANESGHKPGSADWWGVYKAHSAKARAAAKANA